MKKIVFEGIVNGNKYDTIEAYNAEVTRLLANGENVDASCRTKEVEEDEKLDNNPDNFPMPFFNGVKTIDVSYLDELANMSPANLEELLENSANVSDVDSLTKDALKAVHEKAGNIVNQISHNMKENKTNIKQLDASIDRARKLLAHRAELQDKMNTLLAYYQTVLDETSDVEEEQKPQPTKCNDFNELIKAIFG